ncbi:MAG: glycosyl hydrolase family 28-related protein [Phycisphaerales bacterium]
MDRPFINVKLLGAVGDGVTDDTQAIKRAIASIPTTGSALRRNAGPVLYFPEGIYVISETLLIKEFFGLEIRGTGVHPSIDVSDPTGGVFGPRSVLIWKGSSSDPLLKLEGVQGTTVCDLNFMGKEEVGTGSRASVLINIISVSGNGSSWNAIRNCAFRDVTVGIECGGGSGKTDSEILIERVTFYTCDTGFKLTHPQNQNYLFTMLGANNCKCVIDADNGGGVNVQTAALTGCGGEGADDYAFKFGGGAESGVNDGISVLNAVRYESCPKLIRVAGYVRVTCDGFNQSATAPPTTGSPLIKVSNGALVFRNSRWQYAAPFIMEFGTPPTGAWCTVSYDRCQFPFEPEDTTPPVFPVTFVISNPAATRCAYSFFRCDGLENKPLPDAKTSGAW